MVCDRVVQQIPRRAEHTALVCVIRWNVLEKCRSGLYFQIESDILRLTRTRRCQKMLFFVGCSMVKV